MLELDYFYSVICRKHESVERQPAVILSETGRRTQLTVTPGTSVGTLWQKSIKRILPSLASSFPLVPGQIYSQRSLFIVNTEAFLARTMHALTLCMRTMWVRDYRLIPSALDCPEWGTTGGDLLCSHTAPPQDVMEWMTVWLRPTCAVWCTDWFYQ